MVPVACGHRPEVLGCGSPDGTTCSGARTVLGGRSCSLWLRPARPAEPSRYCSTGADALAIAPATPAQGDTLVVLVAASADAQVSVTFDGSAVPAYAAAGGTWRALVGTDPDTGLGSHTVRAVVVLRDLRRRGSSGPCASARGTSACAG